MNKIILRLMSTYRLKQPLQPLEKTIGSIGEELSLKK